LAEPNAWRQAPHPSPVLAAMAARCPRCGKGKLFTGFLTVVPRCANCGVDLSDLDAGDGPAAFIIAIVGFIVVGLALVVEVKYQPPYWVHAALWFPLATILPLAMMRPFKGFFLGKTALKLYFRPLLWPTVFTIAALAVLVSLGNWQLERLAWKNQLAARVTAQASARAIDLPPVADWPNLDLDEWEYRPVRVDGTYDFAAEIHVYTIVSEPRGSYSGPGYWIFTPLNLTGGGAVMVNRGFVPERFKQAESRAAGQLPGRQQVTGRLRKTEVPGNFALAPDINNNVWTVRDLPAMKTYLERPGMAPFLIDADAIAPDFLPQGGETRLKFINNHLDYALTWYGLGIVLLGVYLAFHRAQGRLGKSRGNPSKKAKNQ